MSTENQFQKVVDTVADKAMYGLVETGVLPKGFRVIKGSVDLTGAAIANGYAVIDSATGEQVLLSVGDQILFYSAIATTTIVAGGAATFDIGLAASEGGAVATALTTAGAIADLNTGVNTIPAAAAVTLVGATNQFLAVDVNAFAVTTGALQIILIVC